MIGESTVRLINHENLSIAEAGAVIDEIMEGKAMAVETAAFLTALQAKGATAEEIMACARSMRNHATPVKTPLPLLEIVGTGGDHAQSFNISSTSAFVCAAGGCYVAKHGNRAATSKSGAADVLEALGARISLAPAACLTLLKEVGFCFLFAQTYHRAMKYVAPVRRELHTPTVFNLLGPLTNPARSAYQVLGVYEEALLEPMARALRGLDVKRGMVVFGTDGLDEISPSAVTKVCEFNGDTFQTYTIEPERFGLKRGRKAEIIGGTPAENATITLSVLGGEKGTRRTAVTMNAGAGLYVSGKAATLDDGIRLADELIDSGAALERLQRFITLSHCV